MGQVAFDTLQASEELQTAGLTSQQAKAISLVVRKSHEVADVATKADIADVKRDISDVRKEIADVRKDLSAEIADVCKDLSSEITLVRKDVEALTNSLLIKLSGVMLAIVGAAATIVTLIIKLV
ncbi:hypothetical protein ARAF_0439 [Arsenophonus endosymbiont of Aleurodicus floccissimus]|uniref:hypothetical protein n=1 Tax=Arsenophonus endosymbiont of Aleurodicus floccissimus TaxID=2152761 RepID=UPI000E6B29F7|nr:hypothetical protein [Arsenophonus endosymbiont of Aleurodicus floccissimus]SPP31320.1 hypothetical protein ARAF_0439 [Arsenophonus endosymbiont of Aleurodicus floccissimus]